MIDAYLYQGINGVVLASRGCAPACEALRNILASSTEQRDSLFVICPVAGHTAPGKAGRRIMQSVAANGVTYCDLVILPPPPAEIDDAASWEIAMVDSVMHLIDSGIALYWAMDSAWSAEAMTRATDRVAGLHWAPPPLQI